MFMAERESPPSSTKEFDKFIVSNFKYFFKIETKVLSVLFLGLIIFSFVVIVGVGSKFLSIFPFTFSGKLTIGTIYVGTM